MDYFNWSRFQSAVKQILPYLNVTFRFVVICIIITSIFSVVIAVLRIKKIPVVQQIMGVYVSYMRGVPLLVQLMVVYYGFPILIYHVFHINIIRWSGMIFAVIAMVMNESAFLGESIRGAILSIPAIQSEAGYSIGMTRWQTFSRIVLPQAIRVLIPVYGTTLVGMLQSTAMLYTLGIVDIVQRARTIGSATGHMFEGYAVCAIIYITGSLVIRFVFYKIEQKTACGRGV